MQSTFDVIVIGAGAVGSATAYHVARTGKKVLLLEQFEIDHGRGSSFGHSRIIRYAYSDPEYIQLAKAVYPMWAELQAEADLPLYTLTGGIDFGFPHIDTLQNTLHNLQKANVPFEVFDAQQGMERFPRFRFDEGMQVVYQADAGVLFASRCVLAHVRLAEKQGAVVMSETKVETITPVGEGVEVVTSKGTFSATRLIVTAGAWAGQLLKQVGLNLPLRPIKCQENYYLPIPLTPYESQNMPIFIGHGSEVSDYWIYGLPSVNGSGLKTGVHGGPEIDPDNPDRTPEANVDQIVRQFYAKVIPSAANAPLRQERVCLYTMTPDEHFIMDHHPQHPQIIIGACCSGHAFKFSTLLGEILSDLAIEGETPHDIGLFRLSRFDAIEA